MMAIKIKINIFVNNFFVIKIKRNAAVKKEKCKRDKSVLCLKKIKFYLPKFCFFTSWSRPQTFHLHITHRKVHIKHNAYFTSSLRHWFLALMCVYTKYKSYSYSDIIKMVCGEYFLVDLFLWRCGTRVIVAIYHNELDMKILHKAA